MAKPNFTLPNKPAIKSGGILSYNYTDDFTFVPAPLTFNRDSAATRVNEKGLIEDVGYFGPELVQNGDFEEIGPELIVNGDFSSSDISMIIGAGARSVVNNELKIEENGLAYSQVIYNGILDSSKIYKATFDITLGTGSYEIHGTTQGAVSIYSSGSYTFYLKSTDRFYVGSNGVGDVWYMDNISVKEVGQNWTFNTGWSMGDGVAIATSGSGTANKLIQTNTLNGKYAKVSLDVSNYGGSGLILVDFGSTASSSITSNGTHILYGTYDQNDFQIYKTEDFNGSIDNISVIEVLGDKPRIDYSDSLTEPSLLLEPQSTNLVEYSEDFTTRGGLWQTFGNLNKTLLAAISPDGKKTAALITGLNGAGDNDFRYAFPFNTANKTLTYSVYLKGSGTLRIQISNGVDQAFQNTITLTPDWKRHYVTASFNSTSVNTVYLVLDDLINLTATEYYVWGAQFEELSYPTSYIPTAGSSATRLGETANNAGDVNVFNSEEGVLYANIAFLNDTGNYKAISINDGTSINRIVIENRPVSNQMKVFIIVNSVTVMSSIQTVANVKSFNKIALKWSQDDFSWFFNGVKIYTDSSGNTFANGVLNRLNLNGTSNNFSFEGKIKNIQVFNKALTDRELEILTIQ